MLNNRQSLYRLATAFALVGCLTLNSLAAPPDGKGKGGGGGEEPPPDPPPVTYSVVWFGDFLGGGTWVEDVSSFGEVVGYAYDEISPDPKPFIWTEANGFQLMDDLVDAIEVEMESQLGEEVDLRQGNTLRAALNINDSGRIAGTGRNPLGERITFVLDVALVPPLQFAPLPDGYEGFPSDMSTNGLVLIENASPAYVWSPGSTLVELPESEDVDYSYRRINASGQVVGTYEGKIFRVNVGVSSSFEILAESGNGPLINDSGLVVGVTPGNTKKTKNQLFPSYYIEGLGWDPIDGFAGSLSAGADLNNAGQICGPLNLNDLKVPDTVYLFDPIDGFWSFNDMIDPEEPLWFQGDYQNDCTPIAVSEAPAGYPVIVGRKQINGRFNFVLIPNE